MTVICKHKLLCAWSNPLSLYVERMFIADLVQWVTFQYHLEHVLGELNDN